MADQGKTEWVQRVLGVQVAATPKGGASLLAIWRDAKDQVDAGIATLQDRMRKHPLPALARIADKGLNGVTNTRSVGMLAALTEADSKGAAGAGNVRKAAAAFRQFLDSDAADAIDVNPFKVEVGLRRTLGAALDEIERRLGG